MHCMGTLHVSSQWFPGVFRCSLGSKLHKPRDCKATTDWLKATAHNLNVFLLEQQRRCDGIIVDLMLSMAMLARNRWRFEVATISFWPIFRAMLGDIPPKYGQKYGPNVPPSIGSWNFHWCNIIMVSIVHPHHFPMVFLWFPYDFPMIFRWFTSGNSSLPINRKERDQPAPFPRFSRISEA